MSVGMDKVYKQEVYLKLAVNSLSCSSDTPMVFLAWICCSRLCCIRMAL